MLLRRQWSCCNRFLIAGFGIEMLYLYWRKSFLCPENWEYFCSNGSRFKLLKIESLQTHSILGAGSWNNVLFFSSRYWELRLCYCRQFKVLSVSVAKLIQVSSTVGFSHAIAVDLNCLNFSLAIAFWVSAGK